MHITLDQVTVQFGQVKAVDNLSASFRSGELVALLGPSGCGKSTSLFVLAGIYKPTVGIVKFDNKVMNQVEPEDREIGMVFQNYALYPHMSVLDNILFPLQMKKVPKREARDRAQAMAELVQVGHLLNRKPGQLSGGQQQRVAIARALVKEPKLLLLDEPLSNLDARLRLEMREEIRRIQQETGVTTVFVTHDQEEAMSIADRIVLMQGGKLQQDSTPQTMYREPENVFTAEFIGSPKMNLMNGAQLEDGQTVILTNVSSTGRDVWVGIRPEDWILADNDKNAICEATVTLVENIGRDTLLRADSGGSPLRLFVPQETNLQVGSRIRLGIRHGKARLFDKATGLRLHGEFTLRGGELRYE